MRGPPRRGIVWPAAPYRTGRVRFSRTRIAGIVHRQARALLPISNGSREAIDAESGEPAVLDGHSISVSRALVINACEPQLSDVKTGQRRRTIELDRKTITVLRAWKKVQKEERMLTKVRPEADSIFAHPTAHGSSRTISAMCSIATSASPPCQQFAYTISATPMLRSC